MRITSCCYYIFFLSFFQPTIVTNLELSMLVGSVIGDTHPTLGVVCTLVCL